MILDSFVKINFDGFVSKLTHVLSDFLSEFILRIISLHMALLSSQSVLVYRRIMYSKRRTLKVLLNEIQFNSI